MTLIKANCKFCKRPLSLHIDDEYAKLGDPYNLMKLACCDKCGDYMEARRMVHGKVKKVCMSIFGVKVKKDDLPKIRETLTHLIQRYMRIISDHRDLPMPQWDETLVDDMLEKPGNFSLILSMVAKSFSQGQLV